MLAQESVPTSLEAWARALLLVLKTGQIMIIKLPANAN
jgi:hypothetical protein